MVEAVDVVVDKAEDLVEEEEEAEAAGEAGDFIMHALLTTDLRLHQYMVTLLQKPKYIHQIHIVL